MDSRRGRALATAQRAAALAGEARATVGRFRDPSARLRRQRRRARWGVGVRAVPTAGMSALAAQAFVAGSPIVGTTVAVVAAGGVWATGVATRYAWRLHRQPVPAASTPLPHRGSAARPALERLSRQERALTELLPRLGSSGRDTAEEAGRAAAELHAFGQTIAAVEVAGATATEPERRELTRTVRSLTNRLDDGVAAHARLVAAAADAVAAGSSRPDELAMQRLLDETDRLNGRAAALRELS
jgi:hypothetical protein